MAILILFIIKSANHLIINNESKDDESVLTEVLF
jgi:hypothetical protein